LNDVQKTDLRNLIGFKNQEFSLVYRASRDGWLYSDYHSKADMWANNGWMTSDRHSIVVARTDTNNVFGGFTQIPHSSVNTWRRDSQAFMFSLINPTNNPQVIYVNVLLTSIFVFCF